MILLLLHIANTGKQGLRAGAGPGRRMRSAPWPEELLRSRSLTTRSVLPRVWSSLWNACYALVLSADILGVNADLPLRPFTPDDDRGFVDSGTDTPHRVDRPS
jgi:hypothetical protein